MLPSFLRTRIIIGGAERRCTARGGEWRVEQPRIAWDILDAVRDAAAEIGIPKIDDFNRGDNEGSAYFEVNQRRGRRWSAARGFLKPVAERARTCALVTGAHARARHRSRAAARPASHIAASGARRGRARDARSCLRPARWARRNLLELSGVGAGGAAELGIPVVQRCPGVGENLQDHLQLRPIFRVEGARTLNVDYPLAVEARRHGRSTMRSAGAGR